MFKNTASQKVAIFAWDGAAGAAKTGDAANISAQISKDGGACAPTNDAAPTELDSTDAPGVYIFDVTQAETNGNMIVIVPVSSTANIVIRPTIVYTETNLTTGVGAISWTYTLTDSATGGPIDGAEVWVTSDSAGLYVLASGVTDSAGQVTFMLDAGTVYVWAKKAGYNMDDLPDEEVVA